MSRESTQPTARPMAVRSVLAEGRRIVVVFGFWVVLAVPPAAYQELFAPRGVLGAVLTGFQLFALFVGVANVLLYVLLRANELNG